MLKCPHRKPHRPAVTAHSPAGAEALPGISCFCLFHQASFVLSKNHPWKTSFHELSFGWGDLWHQYESQNTLVSALKPLKVKCQSSIQSTLKAVAERSRGPTREPAWGPLDLQERLPRWRLGTKPAPLLWPWARLLTASFSFFPPLKQIIVIFLWDVYKLIRWGLEGTVKEKMTLISANF